MALNLNEKKVIVAKVAEVASKAVSIVTAEYRGLTATQMTSLRVAARKEQVSVFVAPNSLVKIGVTGTEYECLKSTLTGPLLVASSNDEPGATARLMSSFAKENDKLKVVAISLGGKVYDKSSLESIAKLPNKSQAISMLMSVMQAPITKLVRTMAEPHAKLVRTLAAIRDTK